MTSAGSSPVAPRDADADADAIAAAVVACPSVARLSGGVMGEVATYLPGRRVTGVRLGADEIAVHVVARYGPTVATVAAEVRAAVRAVAGPGPVSVAVDDIDIASTVQPAAPVAPAGPPAAAVGSRPAGAVPVGSRPAAATPTGATRAVPSTSAPPAADNPTATATPPAPAAHVIGIGTEAAPVETAGGTGPSTEAEAVAAVAAIGPGDLVEPPASRPVSTFGEVPYRPVGRRRGPQPATRVAGWYRNRKRRTNPSPPQPPS